MRSRVAVIALVLAAGCAAEEPAVMDRGAFIDVVVQLRQANSPNVDEASFEERKREILEAAGVTDSMLVAFTRRYGMDAGYMAAVWDSVDKVLNPVDTDVVDDPGEAR